MFENPRSRRFLSQASREREETAGAFLPALKNPGWGFHDLDGVERGAENDPGKITDRAVAQIRMLSTLALEKMHATDGHVISGCEAGTATEVELRVFFVSAPVGVAVPISTPPVGVLHLERFPLLGFTDADLAAVVRDLKLHDAGKKRINII